MKLIQKIEELCSNANFVVIIAALISAITAVGIAYRRENAESRKAEDTMEAGIQLRVRSTEQRQVMKTVVSIERRMSLLLSAFR